VTLLLPTAFFLHLVFLYQHKKEHLEKIQRNLIFLDREISRKNGNIKSLEGYEIWEYEEKIRNHPLSIDLDLCTKQGLFPYLDTTVSKEAWSLFLNSFLQIQNVDSIKLQKDVQDLIKNKFLPYQFLRKSLPHVSDSKEKFSIYTSSVQIPFWEKRKLLKLIFPFWGIFTPVWLILSSIFSLPFSPLLLLINLILFVFYKKDSTKIWKQIQTYQESIMNIKWAWVRMDPKNRNKTKAMLNSMQKLTNSSYWVISPIPHFALNILFLWDLWKVKAYFKWNQFYKKEWDSKRESWIRLEANLPIAQFAFLNPDFDFPIWTNDKSFEANEIAHPLIMAKQRISNPLPKIETGNLMILTGSNMSGKTTYLRSIAINLLLAGIGGPICGSAIKLTNFKIHTLIRSQDSLENGISFFYSEVRRLSEIIRNSDASNEISILFLDEILKGTNSRERQIATREILNALKEKGAIVFLTTHDLDLAEIPGAKLYHFTELEKDGQMYFDYHLREGISKTTNALRILRKEGIPIRENL